VVFAHELGHALLHELDEGSMSQAHYDVAMDSCAQGPQDRWTRATKEHASAGATGGFADFFAAVVFNDDGVAADCEAYATGFTDWNMNGSASSGEVDNNATAAGIDQAAWDAISAGNGTDR
jgi:hypothetical protein